MSSEAVAPWTEEREQALRKRLPPNPDSNFYAEFQDLRDLRDLLATLAAVRAERDAAEDNEQGVIEEANRQRLRAEAADAEVARLRAERDDHVKQILGMYEDLNRADALWKAAEAQMAALTAQGARLTEERDQLAEQAKGHVAALIEALRRSYDHTCYDGPCWCRDHFTHDAVNYPRHRAPHDQRCIELRAALAASP
jgi:uncharacterized coiled-coil DUF342 family protein